MNLPTQDLKLAKPANTMRFHIIPQKLSQWRNSVDRILARTFNKETQLGTGSPEEPK
ncbi:hypothetical protein AAMO2058_000162600, partial [Amorphochlora amoebiformis]